MRTVISVDPFRCRMWELHDRMEASISEQTCRAEIESFRKHGQLVPTLGRSLVGDANHTWELVYGARRLFVAQHLNKPLLVEVREMTNSEAIVAMHIENIHRKEVSPYEQGLYYTRLLRTRHFASQDEIARTLRVSASQVSRLVKIAKLPAVLVGVFGNPASICEEWGLKLLEAWEDPQLRTALAEKARSIAADGKQSTPRDIYSQLLASLTKGRRLKPKARDEVVMNDGGVTLFRIRIQGKWVSLLLPIENVSADTLSEVRASVRQILQRAASQCDSTGIRLNVASLRRAGPDVSRDNPARRSG
jgi:ParB family chromosome partitioning protein